MIKYSIRLDVYDNMYCIQIINGRLTLYKSLPDDVKTRLHTDVLVIPSASYMVIIIELISLFKLVMSYTT